MVKSWLAKASRELRVAHALLQLRPPFLSEAAFFCQQSIEKSLKAYLLAQGNKAKKTHQLVHLYHEAKGTGYNVKLSEPKLTIITRYAVSVRYPDAGSDRLTKRKIEFALKMAKS